MKLFSLLFMAISILSCSLPKKQAQTNHQRKIANINSGVIHVYPPRNGESALSVFEEAREEVRNRLRLGERNIKVLVHGGTYFFETSFLLQKEDGAPEGHVLWQAVKGERVRLLGARPVSLTDLKDVKLPFNPTKINQIKAVNLKTQGIQSYGKIVQRGFGLPERITYSEVFQNGVPLQLSRHPNNGWLTTVVEGRPERTFSVKEELSFDSSLSEAWFHGYWGNDWADELIELESKKDQVLVLKSKPQYQMKSSQRVTLLNTAEFLDAEGEFLIDKSGSLYVIPNEAPHGEVQEFLISLTDKPLIRIEEASNIIFQGFEIGFTRGKAILVKGGESVEISSNLIQNTGLEGLYFNGGKSHAARGNRFLNTGTEGIIVEGGERKSLTSSEHVVENNELYKFGRIGKTYHPGIEIRGVGVRVAHNEIAYGPHFAIRFQGNEHLIEYNHVHDVVRETSDAGAIYIGRDWSMRGNIIQYNYIHDNGATLGGPGSMGVYLDDLASGTTIHGNYFYKSGRCAFVGGGRDNIVTSNVFIDCANSYHLDDRGVSWKNVDFFYGKNIELVPKMEAMDYLNPPYSTRYPRLASILNEDPLLPLGNVLSRNLIINSPVKNYKNPVIMEGNVEDNVPKDQASIPTPGDFERVLKTSVKSFPEGLDTDIAGRIGVQDSAHVRFFKQQFEK